MGSKTDDEKVLDEETNRNAPTVTTSLPNGRDHCSIKTSLISFHIKESRVNT